MCEVADFLTATSQMEQRYNSALQEALPKIDYCDKLENRQFAPEYAQRAYFHAKNEEKIPGDYFACQETSLNSSPEHRKEMVYLIEIICQKK